MSVGFVAQAPVGVQVGHHLSQSSSCPQGTPHGHQRQPPPLHGALRDPVIRSAFHCQDSGSDAMALVSKDMLF